METTVIRKPFKVFTALYYKAHVNGKGLVALSQDARCSFGGILLTELSGEANGTVVDTIWFR
jgi:hypothetical protein